MQGLFFYSATFSQYVFVPFHCSPPAQHRLFILLVPAKGAKGFFFLTASFSVPIPSSITPFRVPLCCVFRVFFLGVCPYVLSPKKNFLFNSPVVSQPPAIQGKDTVKTLLPPIFSSYPFSVLIFLTRSPPFSSRAAPISFFHPKPFFVCFR